MSEHKLPTKLFADRVKQIWPKAQSPIPWTAVLDSPWPPPDPESDPIGSAMGGVSIPNVVVPEDPNLLVVRWSVMERRGEDWDEAQEEGWRGLWLHFPLNPPKLYPTFYVRPDELLFGGEGGFAFGWSLGPQVWCQRRGGQIRQAFPDITGEEGAPGGGHTPAFEALIRLTVGSIHLGSSLETRGSLHWHEMSLGMEEAASGPGTFSSMCFACEASIVSLEWEWRR